MPLLPLEIIIAANALLLLLAGLAGLFLARRSIIYRRNIGNDPAQRRHIRVIVNTILLLIIIGLVASALNLLAA